MNESLYEKSKSKRNIVLIVFKRKNIYNITCILILIGKFSDVYINVDGKYL